MAGPVIAATMTRIAAFSPLLFWPGIIGDFMKYLPITLIVTLAASMLYALIFTPTLGAIFAKAPMHHEDDNRDGAYMAVVKQAVRFPITVLVLTVALLGGGHVRLREIRRRRRVLPQCRAGLRPALRACARQPFAGRDGRGDAARPKTGCSAGRA